MPLSELTDRNAVLAAIREYDALGQQAFLKKYGFAPARRFRLLHNGNSYDSKAIAGAAFGYQFPDRGPLKSSEFSGGEETVRPLLEGLGFKVSVDEVAGLNDVPMITAQDIQLIRQSRTKDPDGKTRVFGELMYLLEYRDKEVPLATGGEAFRIPKNVYLIGTMNTADRSIALVDHALRRRFSFIYLEPDYDVLRSHLSEHGLPVDSLINTLKALNAAIDDRHYSVGISFFLTDGKKPRATLEEIWRGEIEPYLDEYFYDQPDKAKAFRWETLVTNELADWA